MRKSERVWAWLRAIEAQKQISYGVAHPQRERAPPPVLLAVVKHVATLAEGLQISQPVGGIMVEMRRRQRHPGRANGDVVSHKAQSSSATVAPGLLVFVPPSTIAQVPDLPAMRAAAPLTPSLGPLKPDHRRKLRPVDRIKPFELGADRHRAFQGAIFAPSGRLRRVRDSRQRRGGGGAGPRNGAGGWPSIGRARTENEPGTKVRLLLYRRRARRRELANAFSAVRHDVGLIGRFHNAASPNPSLIRLASAREPLTLTPTLATADAGPGERPEGGRAILAERGGGSIEWTN